MPQHTTRPPRGRRIWTLSGVVTIFLLAVPVTFLVTKTGATSDGAMAVRPEGVRHATFTQPVTSVSVHSYGGDIRVIGGASTSRAHVTESISYDPRDPRPRVISAVAGGQLILDAPACATQDCSVGFTVTVPSKVAVSAKTDGGNAVVSGVANASLETDGGNIVVSGVAAAALDSGSGSVTATSVSGPLTVASDGGFQQLIGIGGTLKSEGGSNGVVAQEITGAAATITTDGGQLTAMGLAVAAATLDSGGADARVGFVRPPGIVVLSTDGGNAIAALPGGPYAVTADSDGGPEMVSIATSTTASRSVTVTTGGGSLVIAPASSSNPNVLVPVPPVPPAPPAP